MASDKEVKNKKETKNKKSFFKDFKAEIKKVIWPTPKQLVNSTIAVVVIVIITALIVLALDLVFDLFNKQGINRLKAKIRGIEITQNQDEASEDEHDHEHEHEGEESENPENTTNIDELTQQINSNTDPASAELLEKLNQSLKSENTENGTGNE